MGLRINTNVPSLVALRNLAVTDSNQIKTFERLSTGLKINRSSDDPNGLALAENLRSQIIGLRQAVENTETAGNLVSTADAALEQITTLLQGLQKSLVFAMGGATREQIAAEQDAVDSAIDAIKRMASTTRFGDTQLLDGSSGFLIENISSSGILEVKPTSVRLNPSTPSTVFTIDVTVSATQAVALAGSSSALTSIAASGGTVVLQLTGPIGTETINLASSATVSDMMSAVNSLRGFTGIYASGGFLFTENFGTNASMRIEQIGGAGVFAGGSVSAPGFNSVGDIYFTEGRNAVATFQGVTVSGQGNLLSLNTPYFVGDILLNPVPNQDPVRGPGSTGIFSFEIRQSGLLFQFGSEATAINQKVLGISNVSPAFLGSPKIRIGGIETGGFLDSVITGGDNDLFTNPVNGKQVADDSLKDVVSLRSVLGAFVADVVEPTRDAQDVAIENLTASESNIRDADFAVEVAAMTRNQVLFQSGISVLAQANLTPQMVLQLLQ
ncbi:MAG: hypothetical protein A2W23_08330 [Planctomycetes bacterium RBG_16_43_13]|nr:MAG: hypothetical protein A2W23_08330 [Planctomycetes bacterium RBG_16_43_13]